MYYKKQVTNCKYTISSMTYFYICSKLVLSLFFLIMRDLFLFISYYYYLIYESSCFLLLEPIALMSSNLIHNLVEIYYHLQYQLFFHLRKDAVVIFSCLWALMVSFAYWPPHISHNFFSQNSSNNTYSLASLSPPSLHSSQYFCFDLWFHSESKSQFFCIENCYD